MGIHRSSHTTSLLGALSGPATLPALVLAIGMAAMAGGCDADRSTYTPPIEGRPPTGPMAGIGSGGSGGETLPSGGSGGGVSSPPWTCDDGRCGQVACTDGAKTTISGKVYNPSGAVPLFNVIVYVPTGPLAPLPEGSRCDRCGAKVEAVTATLTDTSGSFVLEDVPAGTDVPVVMQVGKWRRQVNVDVQECQDNVLPTQLSHLPRNKSEGNLPQIAIATGGADSLECFLRTMGIDDAEVTRPNQDGRVHLYQGGPVTTLEIPFFGTTTSRGGAALAGGSPPTDELWNDVDTLSQYDMVLMSCEGREILDDKPVSARAAMTDYLNRGGRVFGSHFHYVWFKEGPQPLPQTAEWTSVGRSNSSPFTIDTSHFRGMAFADWLVEVGASEQHGLINLIDVRNNVAGVDSLLSTPWIYKADPHSVKYFSFNTPAGEPEAQCGRAVYTDIHVSGGSRGNFPGGCGSVGELTPQEKALMFLLFDLSSCIDVQDRPPEPPPFEGPR